MKNGLLKSNTIVLLLILLTESLVSQTLPRRVFLGIRMEPLTEDAKSIMGINEVSGVLVNEVFAQSTASNAGWQRGDVMIKLQDKPVSSTAEVFAVLSGQKSGSKFSFELIRDKKLIKGNAVFSSFPEEKYTDISIEYTSSVSPAGPQRIVLSKPVNSEGKLPLIVFIGGIGCYSLDTPFDTSRSEIQLLNQLSRSGFICARLEKPGMGDNARLSTPCEELSFMDESNSYVASIRSLKNRADVDSNAVYIIGHSMGGVFAPLVSQQTKVKGIIAYGTIGSNFIEYLAKTRRTISAALDMNPVETDDFIKEFCACSVYYFVDKLTTEQAALKKPACRNYLSVFDLRSRAYNDELYAFNYPELWSTFRGKALLLWGENDYIASREDHEILKQTIDYYKKGSAEFIIVPQADHGMHITSSFQEAHTNPGPYQSGVSEIVLNWLKKAQS
jgi:pimeloyl-ACP methyl ester carboxylesterase